MEPATPTECEYQELKTRVHEDCASSCMVHWQRQTVGLCEHVPQKGFQVHAPLVSLLSLFSSPRNFHSSL
eukprot:4843920-Amphidinium_carterae.2